MPRAPKKQYDMPEKIPEGTIIADNRKNSFRVGLSIGIGGFGEIYSACRIGEGGYDYVIKCEPSENGPLFVEMHFYIRCGKEEDIKSYQKKKGLKSLGMPHFISSGSVVLNGKSHRFLVMPRYGRNIQHYFLANGKRLPVGTVYRLGKQMLDVLEYVHHCGYTHGDLKAANILVGYGEKDNAQAYLVDFGLAARYNIDKDFKPNPKQAHNGTVEFESRDAHQGVSTMRSDLEILGYNLIHWLGAELPWVRDKLLNVPSKVQAAKVQFMNNLEAELKKLFPESAPTFLIEYLTYINKLKHNETPDYKRCRKSFQDALKTLKVPDTGDLVLELKEINKTSVAASTKRTLKSKRAAAPEIENDNDSVHNASEDDDDDVIFEPKPKKSAKPNSLKTLKVKTPPTKKTNASPKKISPSPVRGKRISPRGAALKSDTTTKSKISPPSHSVRRGTPISAKANINVSPVIKLSKTPSLATRHGSTIVNNNVTPNPRGDKTYEFNVELDVSMDANVVVNVMRKKRAHADEKASGSQNTPKSSSSANNGSKGTPAKYVKVQKIHDGQSPSGSSPRTPIVKVSKRVKRGV